MKLWKWQLKPHLAGTGFMTGLEDEGFKVKLSHPLKTKAIAYAKVKTDKVNSATAGHKLLRRR